MSKRFLILILTVIAISENVYSQSRKYSNEFLAIGVGAKALGMSNSTVASVNDVTAGYWNLLYPFKIRQYRASYCSGILQFYIFYC